LKGMSQIIEMIYIKLTKLGHLSLIHKCIEWSLEMSVIFLAQSGQMSQWDLEFIIFKIINPFYT
jgi:hypothetical protein